MSNGAQKNQKCDLTFSLPTENLEEEGHGEVTIQGAVMPVDDHPRGVTAAEEKPIGGKKSIKLQQAA